MFKCIILIIGFMVGFTLLAGNSQLPPQQVPKSVVGTAPTAKLLFKSNFAPPVAVQKPRNFYPNGKGAWVDIKGGHPPVESEITGLEIWSGFPCGEFKSCYKEGKL